MWKKYSVLIFIVILIVCLLVWLVGPFLRTTNIVSAPTKSPENNFSPASPSPTFKGPPPGTPYIKGPTGPMPTQIY